MSQQGDKGDRQGGDASWLRGDTLGWSVVLLVGLSGLQRLVGLARNVLFCGLLSDEQLGRWSLSHSFLLLAAPLVVLGVPGSFGRYVEHYRQRGQLRSFLRRTALTSALAALTAAAVLLAWPRGVALLLYADAAQVTTVRTLGLVLGSVIAFNFLVELLTALRLIRAVVLMQLVCSLAFAGAGVAILGLTPWREGAVVLAYGVATLLAGILGLGCVLRSCRDLPDAELPLEHRALWKKLLPFAAWIWVGNLVANLFAVTDQFMLKHLSGLAPTAADALVGQYYSSRVVPLLMVGLASLLASGLLPHLTEDWEAGQRDEVRRRVRLAFKLTALGFTCGAALVLIASPLLFGWLLRGKYDAGLAVFPGTLTYCVWFSMFCVLMSYLLCAEKAWLGSLSLGAGLCLNIVLNYLLAPRYALPGVVLATAVANLTALGLLYVYCARSGLQWDRRDLGIVGLPAALCLGGGPALGITLLAVAAGWVFENQQLGRWLRTLVDNRHASKATRLPSA